VLAEFQTLFRGGEHGYGQWDSAKPVGEQASTIRGVPPPEVYERHLKGELGLGIAPVRKDGTCYFAAIDIDIDNIDHKQLFQKIQQKGYPLHVCRSKSGGAHLYLFMREPLSAKTVQTTLRLWASNLGYPKSEIFPKQAQISASNIGNWINLPYFSGDLTTRYCIGHNGALTLQEFLTSIQYYDPNQKMTEQESAVAHKAEMPPCLAALSEHPLPPGSRNTVLFNMAVFYRKSQPHNWEDAVSKHNLEKFESSLPWREVQSVVGSAGRARYQYTCESQPLAGLCDRQSCELLPFGIGHKPWQEAGVYDEMIVTNLRKVASKPPRYIVSVNGRDLELAADDFLNFAMFRKIVYMAFDQMVQPMKQPQWEQIIKEITASKTDIEAPEDASYEGLILERFHEFLALRERSIRRDDILRGLPVQEGDNIIFRASDFRRHLQIYKLDKLDQTVLFSVIKQEGCTHTRLRVNGRLTVLWVFPVNKARTQTEDFEVPNFEVKGKEDL
jgi:hypothetical protein